MIFRKQKLLLGGEENCGYEIVELGCCPDCDGENWFVFLLGPNFVPHVKCVSCNAIFRNAEEGTTDPNDQPQRVMPGEVLRLANIPPSGN